MSKDIIKSKIFRNIVERSHMTHNDETVFYTPEVITVKEFNEFKNDNKRYAGCTLVISRPVYPVELTMGLDIQYQGQLDEEKFNTEKLRKIVDLIDSYFRIKKFVDMMFILNPDLSASNILAFYIGNNYYDCMSGGMSHFEFLITKHLCKHVTVDKSTEVYPNYKEESWSTINDFLNEGNDDSDTLEKELLSFGGIDIKQLPDIL